MITRSLVEESAQPRKVDDDRDLRVPQLNMALYAFYIIEQSPEKTEAVLLPVLSVVINHDTHDGLQCIKVHSYSFRWQ